LSGSQIQNVTSTSFQMVILLGTTGSYTIRVNNPDGGTSNVFSFNVAGPAISSVSPNPVTGSNTAQPFTINGSGFVSGDTVTLRDKTAGQIFTNRTISSLTSNQIVINPNFPTAAHTWSVEVLNSLGGSSGEFIFQVVSPPLSNPQITSISPATPTANGSNQTVTVDGSQFQSGLTVSVTFPGGSSTLSGTQIQNVTASSFQMIILVGTTGSYTIRVNNPDGGTSNVLSFNVAGPAISSVSPNPVTGSNTAQPFTINGSGFVSGDTVTLRDKTAGQIFTNRTISSLTTDQIVINPNFTHAAHTWAVEVFNTLAGSFGEFIFQVSSPPLSNPQITSISPATPTANGSNQTVTVDGSQFQSGLTVSVTFPGGSSTLSGTQIQNVTASSFQMIILVGTTGSYTIRVNNPDGGTSNVFSFNVAGPAISSV